MPINDALGKGIKSGHKLEVPSSPPDPYANKEGAHTVHIDEAKEIVDLPEAKIARKRESCAFLGDAVTAPARTAGGTGWFQHYQNGSIYWSPKTGACEVHGGIRQKWEGLGWEQSHLGYPISDEVSTPGGRIRFSQFQSGTIYWTSTGAWEVHGPIQERYDALGSADSWLGLPTSDVVPYVEDGLIATFEKGAIYWWPDTGAIELNDVIVQYTGLNCFAETKVDLDDSPGADEPYVIVGFVSPGGNQTFISQIYNDVDAGESRPDLAEIYRGKPYGISMGVILMEHSIGNPNDYKDKLAAAVDTAAATIAGTVAVAIPVVGWVVGPAAGGLIQLAKGAFVDFFANLLGDRKLGEEIIALTTKEMIVLAAQRGSSTEKAVSYKLVTPLMSRYDADYKVYFSVVPA